jgi:hypothetical protein
MVQKATQNHDLFYFDDARYRFANGETQGNINQYGDRHDPGDQNVGTIYKSAYTLCAEFQWRYGAIQKRHLRYTIPFVFVNAPPMIIWVPTKLSPKKKTFRSREIFGSFLG